MIRSLLGLSVAAVLCVAVIPQGARAEDPTMSPLPQSIATPPMIVATNLDCIAANLGRVPVTLNIQLHDVDGTVVLSQLCTLPAGALNGGGQQCAVLQGAPAFAGYCTFTATHGSILNIRAAIVSQNDNTQGMASLPAE